MVFDTDSREVVGGVLRESPIDFDPNRHTRKHPQVTYHGDFLAITASLRGESPRRASMWGNKVTAEAHYPAKYKKPCRLSPAHIWGKSPEPGSDEPTLQMLHATDESLFRVVEARCNWDLSDLRRLSGAAKQTQARPTTQRSESVALMGRELIRDAKERTKHSAVPAPGDQLICVQGHDGEHCTSFEN